MTDAKPLPGWARRIRLAREDAGMSRNELGKAAGNYSPSAVAGWEIGTGQPNMETFEILSRIFGCDFLWLVQGRGRCPAAHSSLRDAEAFVRRATSYFDQPPLDDEKVTTAARKVLKALNLPTDA